jgi:hypothetical protein
LVPGANIPLCGALRLVGFCPNPEISTSDAAEAGFVPNNVADATTPAAIAAAGASPFAMCVPLRIDDE